MQKAMPTNIMVMARKIQTKESNGATMLLSGLRGLGAFATWANSMA